MQKRPILVSSLLILSSLVLSTTPVLAGKSMEVIARSNGFPSGRHFNLNLHGRDPAGFTGDPGAGGNSVFVNIVGDSTIEYLSNKRNFTDTELTVLDPLSEDFDGNPAQVYLPYNIWDDTNGDDTKTRDEVFSAGGYFVFGRILAKPDNGSSGNASSILIYPNFVVASGNATEDNGWPYNLEVDDEISLGFISSSGNLYRSTPEEFVRFDPAVTTGKGKSPGKDISGLFYWSGFVTDNTSLDTNGNGYLDILDTPISYDGQDGSTPNGTIEQTEFEAWLAYLDSIGQGDYYDPEHPAWIFDIADMVISGQTVVNDGTKLFQIRFYPVVTTEFESSQTP